MPNIYLRMSASRCAFFRHRDPTQVLAPHEPVVFSPYSLEFRVIRDNLTNAQAVTQRVNPRCFSHQQWVNMTKGRSPIGGKQIVARNKEEYLTFAEVQLLNGKTDNTARTKNADYLCIKLPTEVQVVESVRAVTPTWCLTDSGVSRLYSELDNDFKRSLVEWALSTFDYCTSDGRIVCRGHFAMLERYLMRYGIEPTDSEKDNMRRSIDRWLRSEHNNFKSYSCIDMTYPDSREKSLVIDDIQWLD